MSSLPIAEFAFPGPLRDRLVAAILSGEKTSTSSLLHEYELDGDPVPSVGERSAVVDSDGAVVAVIEITGVAVVPLLDVDLQHALDEGEGYASIDDWRAGHLRFWRSDAMRAELGDDFEVDDATPVVLERFRLV